MAPTKMHVIRTMVSSDGRLKLGLVMTSSPGQKVLPQVLRMRRSIVAFADVRADVITAGVSALLVYELQCTEFSLKHL